MAASSPIAADRPSIQGFRRSSSSFASLPTRKLSVRERAGLDGSDAAEDILYTHQNVKIFTFKPPDDQLKLSSANTTLPDADYPIDAIEVLPWRSRTETLQATGKMIIEKVRGSGHFLKSGTAVYTLMRNSQIWCVDGESKFVMRTGRFKYNRIEFPCATEEEKQKIEDFKTAVSKILKFESTPCPFIRAFSVELPEDAITPRRKGQWKRTTMSPVTPDEEQSSLSRRTRIGRRSSLRDTPPSAFPTRSMAAVQMERPRTASNPLAPARYSNFNSRDHSPASTRSGDETSESDRHDSESERLEINVTNASDHDTNALTSTQPRSNHVQSSSLAHNKWPVKALRERIERQVESSAMATTSPSKSRSKTNVHNPNATVRAEEGSQAVSPQFEAGLSQKSSTLETPLPFLTEQSNSTNETSEEVEKPTLYNREEESRPTAEAAETVIEEPELSEVEQAAQNKEPIEHADQSTTPTTDTQLVSCDESIPADSGFSEQSVIKSIPHVPVRLEDFIVKAEIEDCLEPTHNTESEEPTFPSLISVTKNEAALEPSPPNVSTIEKIDTTDLSEPQHKRELSEVTIVAPASPAASPIPHVEQRVEDETDEFAPSQTPALEETSSFDYSWLSVSTPGGFDSSSDSPYRRLPQRRTLSADFDHAALTTPSAQGAHLPPIFESVQKAATFIVNKPVDAVILFVHILARIARGATIEDIRSGDLFRAPGASRHTGGVEGPPRNLSNATSEEDDFGVPLPLSGRRTSTNNTGSGLARTGELKARHARNISDGATSFASID